MRILKTHFSTFNKNTHFTVIRLKHYLTNTRALDLPQMVVTACTGKGDSRLWFGRNDLDDDD